MAITLFIFSIVGITGLFSYKAFEIKIRRIPFLSNIFEMGDRKIHQFIERFVFHYNHIKKVAHIFVFDFIPSFLYELLTKAKDHVAKRYYNTGDSFRGKRVLRNNGSVSFFLEKLSPNESNSPEHKDEKLS